MRPALATAEEAVRLYRTLATARPDAFTPHLAGSLSNLASFLNDLGRREEALAAGEEAVRLRRTLAAARPDAFTPDLATSLCVLGDPVSLAAAAVAVLSPYLSKFGEGAATKLGGEAVEGGGKLHGWLRAKLGGPAEEALNDLAAKPDDGDNQADLRKQLAKALEADPSLAAELRTMLASAGADGGAMTQNVSGAGAKAAQIRGSNNKTIIG